MTEEQKHKMAGELAQLAWDSLEFSPELRNMETMVFGDMKMKNVELNTLMNLDKSYFFDKSIHYC